MTEEHIPGNGYGKRIVRNDVRRTVKLFPIFLVEHNEKWSEYYKKIETSLQKILSDYPVDRISHIGSTAI